MDKEKVIYSLCVEDILTAMEDNDIKLKLDQKDIKFIEDKIGEVIDWRSAIEFALWELRNRKQKNNAE